MGAESIEEEIKGAIEAIWNAKRIGQPISDYLNQYTFNFEGGEHLTGTDVHGAMVGALALSMSGKEGNAELKQIMKGYNEASQAGLDRLMYGLESKEDLLRYILQNLGHNVGESEPSVSAAPVATTEEPAPAPNTSTGNETQASVTTHAEEQQPTEKQNTGEERIATSSLMAPIDITTDESFALMHSEQERKDLVYRDGESYLDFMSRNNLRTGDNDAKLYFYQKYGNRWGELEGILSSIKDEPHATGVQIGRLVDEPSEGYDMIRLLKEIPVEAILPFNDGVSEGVKEKPHITKEPKPIGKGAFGDIYDQFRGKAKEAIEFLRNKKSGEAVAALHHKDIGDIDLVWGEEGTGKGDGYGLAKLIKYHHEVLDKLQEILDDMHVVQRSENRVHLESDTHQASVRLTWDNEKKNWLLTAFEKKNSALDNTTDTGKTSNGGKRNDTATPQSTVSAGKGTKKSSSVQGNGEKIDDATFQKVAEDARKVQMSDAEREDERMMVEAMADLLNAMGVETSTDWEEGQRVLDAYEELNGGSKEIKAQRNIESGINALEKIANGAEEVRDAMTRDDLSQYGGDNSITFYYGKVGDASKDFKKGYGIAHIGGKHGAETLLRVLNVIANGKIDRYVEGNKTVVLTDGEYETVLALTRFGDKETWLFNGWEKDEGTGADGEVSTHSDATQVNPTFSREDLGAVLSDAKLMKSSETAKLHKVFHGSGANFDTFDHSHMGEGEGSQAYGWGSYVTEVEGIGRTYAESMRRPYTATLDGKEIAVKNNGTVIAELSPEQFAAERLFAFRGDIAAATKDIRGIKDYCQERIAKVSRSQMPSDSKARRLETANMTLQKCEEAIKMLEEGRIECRPNENGAVLYTVEIPGDNGHNYFDWSADSVPPEMADAITERLFDYLTTHKEYGWTTTQDHVRLKGELDDMKGMFAEAFYNRMAYYLGNSVAGARTKGKQLASEMLSDMGFVGIKYPAEYRSGGRDDGAMNYVVFDERDLQITDKARFFRTSNGDVYGFTLNGKIYLDPRIATSETPLHEYVHLWSEALEKANPEAWAHLKAQLSGDEDLMRYVKELYPEIEDENELMHEVFSHFAGKRGKERLDKMREKEERKSDGIINKARIAMFQRLANLLQEYWNEARKLFAGNNSSLKDKTAEDFADMAMADFMKGFNPNAEMEKRSSNPHKEAQLRKVVAANAMEDAYHTGIRSVEDIKTFEEVYNISKREAENGGYDELASYPDITNDMIEQALGDGHITIYSSKPIEDGAFVTPSRMQAEDYAGGGRVYSMEVPLEDVAWINLDEGQYAKVEKAQKEHRDTSKLEVKDMTSEEMALRDALVEAMADHLNAMGVETSTDWEEGQRVLDADAERRARLMGSRTERRKADIAEKLKGRELSAEQKAVVDVFTGEKNNAALSVTDKGGQERRVIMRQGNEESAGTKHSIYRHYETSSDNYSAEEILLIPDIIKNGERNQEGKRVSYTLKNNGIEYTVTTEQSEKGLERFTNFFTNKKQTAVVNDTSNTDEQHVSRQSVSSAKLQKISENEKERTENIFAANSVLNNFKKSEGSCFH